MSTCMDARIEHLSLVVARLREKIIGQENENDSLLRRLRTVRHENNSFRGDLDQQVVSQAAARKLLRDDIEQAKRLSKSPALKKRRKKKASKRQRIKRERLPRTHASLSDTSKQTPHSRRTPETVLEQGRSSTQDAPPLLLRAARPGREKDEVVLQGDMEPRSQTST